MGISVLAGNGDGSFSARRAIGTGKAPTSLAAADLDADGMVDLAASTGANTVGILRGNGDLTFGLVVDYGTGSNPNSLAIADLNGDAMPDLVTANAVSNTVTLLLNQGAGPPTATLLSRFDAVWAGEGIEVRWQFGPDSHVLSTTVERGESSSGPWIEVGGERRLDSGIAVLVDSAVEAGHTYFYRLRSVLPGGEIMTFGPVSTAGETIATRFALLGASPSPSRGSARIDFALPRAALVRVTVLDVTGRRAALLVDGTLPAGRHEAVWEWSGGSGRSPAGLYFVRFEWPGGSATRRLVLTR